MKLSSETNPYHTIPYHTIQQPHITSRVCTTHNLQSYTIPTMYTHPPTTTTPYPQPPAPSKIPARTPTNQPTTNQAHTHTHTHTATSVHPIITPPNESPFRTSRHHISHPLHAPIQSTVDIDMGRYQQRLQGTERTHPFPVPNRETRTGGVPQ